MRRVKFILLTVIMVLGVIVLLPLDMQTASAQTITYDVTGGQLTFDTTTGEINRANGSLTDIVIPSTINGFSVTGIRNNGFSSCLSLTSVSIPSSVTSIGESAFSSCENLTSVSIPEGVTNIGYGVFANCTRLTSVSIPSSVTSIGMFAFGSCSSLTSVSISSSVTSISKGAFGRCSSLTSVSIPSSVTSIGEAAFQDCHSLTSVSIPSSLTSISAQAFESCGSLTSLRIPEGVVSIDSYAFHACSSLVSVSIPSSVTSIGEVAFGACDNLSSVYFYGNAPMTNAFSSTKPYLTFYYLAGKTGFTNPWHGYATAVFDGTISNNSSISPTTASWDKYSDSSKCVPITVSLNANSLTSITNGGKELTFFDYSWNLNICSINPNYLASQPVETTEIDFNFSNGDTKTLIITVTNKVGIKTQPLNATLNAGDGLYLCIEAGGGDSLSYQWYSNEVNSTSSGTAITGATESYYGGQPKKYGTTYYYCIVTSTSADGNKTSATSDIATVVVNPPINAVVPVIAEQPADKSVNVGGNAKLSVVVNDIVGTLTYQWYSNTTNSTSDGTAISGATDLIFTAPTTTRGETYYYCIVTNTDNAATTTKSASTTSGIAKVTATMTNWTDEGNYATVEPDLSGTTFTIDNAAELAWVAVQAKAGFSFAGYKIIIARDIDLSDHLWIPIESFAGNFDGNNKTIANLIGDNGLFLSTSGATIKNIGLKNINISGAGNTGGLVGNASSTTITNCYTTGAVHGGIYTTGGLVGEVVSNGSETKIVDSYSTCVVVGSFDVGGLIGYTWNGSIINCHTTGNVTGGCVVGSLNNGEVGGLNNGGGSITNCYTTGNVTGGDNSIVGGLAGTSVNDPTTNCFATGNVTGGKGAIVGGLVAKSFHNILKNSYATGNVMSGDSSTAGGFLGYNEGGYTTNCYAIGSLITGGNYAKVGGFVGNALGGQITNCYATSSEKVGLYGNVGGLLGYNETSNPCTISYGYWNSSATQTVNSIPRASSSNLGVGGGTDASTAMASTAMKSNNFVNLLNTYASTDKTLSSWKSVSDTNDGFPMLNGVGITFQNSTISPTTGTFNKNSTAQADVSTTVTLNGNSLASITNGTATLSPITDYSMSNNAVIIKKAYLAAQSPGTTTLTFNFSAGISQTLTITVVADNTSSETWTDQTASKQKNPSDFWTITFNKDVDISTVNKTNIYVAADESGTNKVDDISVTQVNGNARQVKVSPPAGGWQAGGTYYLFISNQVKAASGGQTLNKGTRMKFNVTP